MSRIDQPVFARDVAAMTGLPAARVERIVKRLLEIGAIALDMQGATVRRSVSSIPAVQTVRPGTATSPPRESQTRMAVKGTGAPHQSHTTLTPTKLDPPTPRASESRSSDTANPPTHDSRPTPAPARRSLHRASEQPKSGVRLRTATPPLPATEGLQLYQRAFSTLTPSDRANRAQRAQGDELVALCHDPHPQVVLALMANSNFSSRFARLVALYHQNPSGLELLARNRDLIADPKVQLCLLLNPNLTEPVLKRLMRRCGLGDLYRLGSEQRVPEEIRQRILQELSERFSSADGEERADLIYWSEGRVLELLRGCPFDECTTTQLVHRTYTSPELIRRLATFMASPSVLLDALAEQAIVKEHRELAELIAQHPNAPPCRLQAHRGRR